MKTATKLLAIFVAISTSVLAGNTLTITEEVGVATKNYPIQLARPFVKGEIPGYPQVVLNGNPVLTQSDVKTRYNDGSVQHAIISFYIPNLNANEKLTVSFINQSSGNNSNFLSQNQMLGSGYNFDVKINIADGNGSSSASARSMLQSNNFTYWMKGENATTVIIADHSLNRLYDIGLDSNRSIRPIFHATFFPLINKVKIRCIGENSNTIALQDQMYNLTIDTAYNNSAVSYTKNNVNHFGGSRWTKEYWIGGKPSTISIDHNLAYLSSTGAISNFDTNIVITNAMHDYDYVQWDGWQQANKDLYDHGLWQPNMPTTGGRPDIGPYPKWTVMWLYNGYYKAAESAFGNADLAAAWPLHLREGDPTRKFDLTNSIDGLGKVISIRNRPKFWSWWDKLNSPYADSASRIYPVGYLAPTPSWETNGHGWNPDGAHAPEPFYAQYLLSGEYFYLEELQFWASWYCAYTAAGNAHYLRGSGEKGIYQDQTRGEGWALRTRARAAYASPDGTPEKEYFTQTLNEMISGFEGRYLLNASNTYDQSVWNFMATVGQGYNNSYGTSPLHHWEYGSGISPTGNVDNTMAKTGSAPFMTYYLMYSLGCAKDFGFKTDSLIKFLAVNIIPQASHPDYNPYFIASINFPNTYPDGSWISSWADMAATFRPTYDAYSAFKNQRGDAVSGYIHIISSALAVSICEPNGMQAWNWIKANARDSSTTILKNPMWAINPRTDCQVITSAIKKTETSDFDFSVFPNPSDGRITISTSGAAGVNLSIEDITGKAIQTFTTKLSSENLIVENLSPGIYILRSINTNQAKKITVY